MKDFHKNINITGAMTGRISSSDPGKSNVPQENKPALRKGLPPLPARLAMLPVNEKGYPIPYFVAYVNGKADFRITDPAKWVRCVKEKRCWICGQQLGRIFSFVAGPMCGVNRTSGEPPMHVECAEFSARACPFLTLPKAQRRDSNIPEEAKFHEGGILRNPGVTMVWITREYKLMRTSSSPLITMGEPLEVRWYREGRLATAEEVRESYDSGCPALLAQVDASNPREQLIFNQYQRRFEDSILGRWPGVPKS